MRDSLALRLVGLRLAAGRALPLAALGVLPLIMIVLVLAIPPQDFEVFWQAGRDFLAGDSPYPAPEAAVLATERNFVYPPPAALAFAPLTILPFPLAVALFTVIEFAAVALLLYVLGVRDRRCYVISFLAASVLNSVIVGAISALLGLGIALSWRYRDRVWIVALLVSGLVVAKLFLWPLLVWLAVTKRVRSAALALTFGVTVTVGAWSLIGFAGFKQYPELLSMLAQVEQGKSYSPLALGLSAGLSTGSARALALLLGLAALAAIFVLARRADGDRLSLTAALGAALALSPIVWMHYFVILLVPMALARPRLAPLWLLPLAFWASPEQSHGELWRIAIVLAVSAATLVVALRTAPRPSRLGS